MRLSINPASLISFFLFIAAPIMQCRADSHEWGYSGDVGPKHWGEMKTDYAACGKGRHQSPIDIIISAKNEELKPLVFNYHEASFKIINNGHTVQVDYPAGSSIRVNGEEYDLSQFHFHKPSEERIKGMAYDMEVHLVHKNKSGKLAVVAVFFKIGRSNWFIQELWKHLPRSVGEATSFPELKIDVGDLLPKNRSYYTYEGSLTTPPCTEGVTWFVLKTPLEASMAQIDEFGELYNKNARPVQPLNGRMPQESP